MRIYQESQRITSDRDVYIFNDVNDQNEPLTVEIDQSLIAHVGTTCEASLTPEQIEEIKRSVKNDHKYFA